jgi:hypothetical protein
MPLVVPGVNNVKGDKNEWLNKLAGKTITEETSDVTVCFAFVLFLLLYYELERLGLMLGGLLVVICEERFTGASSDFEPGGYEDDGS